MGSTKDFSRFLSQTVITVLFAVLLSIASLGVFGTYAYADDVSVVADSGIVTSDDDQSYTEGDETSDPSDPVVAPEEAEASDVAESNDVATTPIQKPELTPTKAGWLKDADGTWYYFTSVNTKPSTGWILSGGKWYWLSPDDNGAMATSQFIDDNGTLYYVDAEGIMLTGWFKVEGDWYFANKSGAIQTGWVKSGGKWYWLMPGEGGKMAENQWIVDGKDRYYLTDKGPGQMATGWFLIDGDWYFANPSGAQQTGWIKSNGKWYWLIPNENGKMAQNQWIEDNGQRYYLTNDGPGKMATGWFTDSEGEWYFANPSGAAQTGWVKSNNKWYWLMPDEGGKMAQSQWIEDGGKRYYLTDRGPGQMATGWISIGDDWYYADPSGAQQREGWLFTGGKWYWLQGDKDGLMFADGLRDINNATYSFEPSGAMRFNTLVDLSDESVGYANPSGAITTLGVRKDGNIILQNEAGQTLTGWQEFGEYWLFGDEGGVAHTGWLESNGKTYWMDSNGIMATGARLINGERYYFDGSGARIANCTQAYRATLQRAYEELARCTNSSMTKEQKLRAAFNHITNDFSYANLRIPHMKELGWETIYADDIFVSRKGNCFSYAAAFAFMAKALGYEDVYACNGNNHGWCEIDGLVYDPQWQIGNTTNWFGITYGSVAGKAPWYVSNPPASSPWMRVAL